ncbi:protein-S-isoprenylcysteine O-methyltransferase [Myxacorys almedinensis]|uniref:Isoprenylcysteine carboxylmethyltransferase family protein n=1 Tax=Myxacorys almedinensis A TaxID=2690445 RepID=A0A8J7Z4W9_9CYAN|nr:protein-S-isoprenylcysteine O-methyltransferase [Myxacorys almedinensis]NDJ17906.1 isoprenylcysteine carboxylmethyltransferase family protein [Myxacorys almedinensis A]
MDTVILKIIYLIGLAASTAIRLPHQRKNKQNTIADDRKTPLEKTLLLLVFLGMFVLPLLYVFSPWLRFADYELPLWANGLGVLSFAIGLWLFWRAHRDLGENWSPTLQIREGHTLITNGIYQTIRHPMYTSIWLWGVAQALLLPNWIAGLAGIISFGILYVARIGNEEQMMLDQFGDQYQAYVQQTNRLIPYLF